jgi:hypothetical protein
VSDIGDTLREELSALLDGALPEERAAELRRRLESDAALRKEYDELQRTVAAVRALPRPSAPAELRARLEKKLMAPPAAGVRRLRFRLAVAAVVTVAVGAGVLALRPSGPEPVYEEARQQDPEPAREALRSEFKQPGKAEGLGKTTRKLADAEASKAEAELDDVRRMREPPALRAPASPAEEKEEAAAPRAKAGRGGKAEDMVRDEDEGMLLGGRKGEATAAALLRSAGNTRVSPETRMPYLFQLNQLNATKVAAHLKEVNATWGGTYRVEEELPPSVNLTVTNVDEARQIFTVLRKYPGTAGRGTAATLAPPGMGGKAPLLTAEVEVTPAQWRSVGTWLQLMNVAGPKPTVRFAEEEGRGSAKKKRARPDVDAEKAKEQPAREPADPDAKRKVKIYIRYPQAKAPVAAAREKK